MLSEFFNSQFGVYDIAVIAAVLVSLLFIIPRARKELSTLDNLSFQGGKQSSVAKSLMLYGIPALAPKHFKARGTVLVPLSTSTQFTLPSRVSTALTNSGYKDFTLVVTFWPQKEMGVITVKIK